MLTEASINSRVDHLRGLKENVIMGHLVPAGTGHPETSGFKLNREQLVLAVEEEEATSEESEEATQPTQEDENNE